MNRNEAITAGIVASVVLVVFAADEFVAVLGAMAAVVLAFAEVGAVAL